MRQKVFCELAAIAAGELVVASSSLKAYVLLSLVVTWMSKVRLALSAFLSLILRTKLSELVW